MSESPNKPEATPGAAEATPKKELFSEREEKVLKFAWQCLKSGPPDVDIKKLTQVAGFNTEKTASNTWGVIKKKLATLEAVDGDSTVEGERVLHTNAGGLLTMFRREWKHQHRYVEEKSQERRRWIRCSNTFEEESQAS